MVVEDAALSEELRRLRECVREPIRTPGRIQSHGKLMVIDPASQEIVVASENAQEWLGRSLADLRSRTIEWTATSSLRGDPVRVDLDGVSYDAVTHTAGPLLVLELEPLTDSSSQPASTVVDAIRRLGAIGTVDELHLAVAAEVKRMTGFDRVMTYRFFDDGHGEVAGEAAEPDMESYQGLRFPASDIPEQARALYLTKLSRAIVSTEDPGSALVALDPELPPLDLSQAELRAVSPHHLQFMRNMGQASTVSFSLIHDGRLIGMITCAHRTEKRMPLLLRRAIEVLAAHATLQLTALESIATLRRDLSLQARRTALTADLPSSADALLTLVDRGADLLALVEADGAIVSIDGVSRSIGHVPLADRSRLLSAIGTEPFATNEVARTHPELADLVTGFAGVLVVPLGAHGVLVLFRVEATRVIRWLGDQSASNRDTPLSPRRSFSEWQQSVEGTALEWGVTVEEARALAQEIETSLDRRGEARLAQLALIDYLTGLHNRRALVARIEAALADGESGAVFFIDLDGFKQINDSRGHETGDHVLRVVAERLTGACRESDLVARLAGDEFVVFSAQLSAADSVRLAHRFVERIDQPIETERGPVRVSGSCGFVELQPGRTATQVIEEADAAMYRAKRAGRNGVSR
ncbi:sensor domain-containing diguanylate cyclase [Leifsonia aquatica]|uniref:Diguanylate cyclase domain protein n=2 Tax=Leifsonia aquatica TaxID=144185 RepID=U2RRK3_LEIAQ|nr:sensor domain-containing diguanylate cyclase [Leifsonia aquatica]ERK71199.1 diguanylate cyclase domain protein [Leifsonia aquatica ATCC 14665]MBB2968940.1 diguanylate cyclase (GGDEF)-like protein [Leifsonia aquatica]